MTKNITENPKLEQKSFHSYKFHGNNVVLVLNTKNYLQKRNYMKTNNKIDICNGRGSFTHSEDQYLIYISGYIYIQVIILGHTKKRTDILKRQRPVESNKTIK